MSKPELTVERLEQLGHRLRSASNYAEAHGRQHSTVASHPVMTLQCDPILYVFLERLVERELRALQTKERE